MNPRRLIHFQRFPGHLLHLSQGPEPVVLQTEPAADADADGWWSTHIAMLWPEIHDQNPWIYHDLAFKNDGLYDDLWFMTLKIADFPVSTGNYPKGSPPSLPQRQDVVAVSNRLQTNELHLPKQNHGIAPGTDGHQQMVRHQIRQHLETPTWFLGSAGSQSFSEGHEAKFHGWNKKMNSLW